MAWIRTIDPADADDELRNVYARVLGERGKLSNILAVHSLRPATLQAHMDLYLSILFSPAGLSREEREMIAVVVSAANACPYCIQHHAAALQHYWKDEEKLARFVKDFRSIELTPRMQAALDYAQTLTATPHAVCQDDVVRLRESGMEDAEILLINLIVSYFNFVNRIALGLGVEFNDDEVCGYEY